MKRKIPPYNVIIWDFNQDILKWYDIMPYFVECWKEEKKRKHKLWNRWTDDYRHNENANDTRMPETFNEFKKFILHNSMYRFWSRCEYEVIVTGWPVQKNDYKLDIHEQVESNIDIITKHFMDYING